MKAKPIGKPPHEDVQRRVEFYKANYVSLGNEPFRHFLCPILLVDEETELIKGHVIPDATRQSGIWVPQRSDVDNFFGSAVEDQFVTAVTHDPNESLIELFKDKEKYKKLKPKTFLKGENVGHYFTKDHKHVPSHQSAAVILDNDGKPVKKMVFDLDPADVAKLPDDCNPEIVIEINQDFVPAVLASVLKAAHLTMFYLLKYEWVSLNAGKDLAGILGRFFLAQHDNTETLAEETTKYFSQFKDMVKPIHPVGGFEALSGTLHDKRCVAFMDSNRRAFVFGIVVRACGHMFIVFCPANDETINTYFDFMKEPASSVEMHVVEWTGEKWQGIHAARVAYQRNE